MDSAEFGGSGSWIGIVSCAWKQLPSMTKSDPVKAALERAAARASKRAILDAAGDEAKAIGSVDDNADTQEVFTPDTRPEI